ncbi:MAG: 3-oxoacyl-ACP reductase FabG [Akkermansiaceae bacterium]|nr:3-oxoacyl-ACP reductase FabG [Akkermansiaceae bacterium]MCP5543201.1 3-oxoacyl-ACP reductase FabG [Akkermansiaceae bacterium]MCP5546316.1 3-oxoacyl-ACP reductase FabG [Akkermansiaceae bacterium]
MTAAASPSPPPAEGLPAPEPQDKSNGLHGRVAVVTGSDSGIGRAIAIELARAGAAVAVSYHNDREGAEETADRIRALGRDTACAELDVSDADSVKTYFTRVTTELGSVDILVNNSGVEGDHEPLAGLSLASWDQVMAVNLRGTFLCTQTVLSDMILRRRGVVLNITSVHETIPWAGHAAYCASKAGISMMSRSLALELQDVGIRIVCLAPGAIATSINRETRRDPAGMADLLDKIPMRRVGKVAEIAAIARMLVSDEASYVTGSTVTVDGGMTSYPSFSHGG